MGRVVQLVSFYPILLGILLALFSSSAQSLPLFIPNVGQFPEHVRYVVWGGGQTLWLTQDALWILVTEKKELTEKGLLCKPGEFQRFLLDDTPQRAAAIKISFAGANPHLRLEPLVPLNTRVNYFLGNDPAKWRTNVPTYSGVRFKEVYPGIDVEIFGEEGRWTWRVRAQPWADLNATQLKIEGAEGVTPVSWGGHAQALQVFTSLGTLVVPLIQVGPRPPTGDFPQLVQEQAVRVLNPFQSAKPLAPSTSRGGLIYLYLLGGDSDDLAFDVAVDTQGCAYITGETFSWDFPTTPGAFQDSYHPYPGWEYRPDAFIAKISPDGSSLVYSTYLGGHSFDVGLSIAVDAQGYAYVAGWTSSTDFPITSEGYQTAVPPDAFVVKLSPSGSSLVYAAILGGTWDECAYGIAVDDQGQAYVAGKTTSSDFPTTPNAYQTILRGDCDAFVAKFDSTGSRLLYATLLGGSSHEVAFGIAIDGQGNAYVAGFTRSPDFPATSGAYQPVHGGGSFVFYDAFIAKLDPMGSTLLYATFLGGDGDEIAFGINIDSEGNAYVTGHTSSPNFPATPNAFQKILKGAEDVFIAKFNAVGSSLLYATFLGGDYSEAAKDIVVDSQGFAYITGVCFSEDFPITPGAYQPNFAGIYDAFIAKLDPTGSALVYATFLGGKGQDWGYGITTDHQGYVYVAGYWGPDEWNDGQAFIAKLNLGSSQFLGVLRGRVTDKATGKGLVSALVSTQGNSTNTDANGYYALSLSPGTYTVRVSAQGYNTVEKSGVKVEAGSITTLDFELTPLRGTLKGRVTDKSTGRGIAEALVKTDKGSTKTDKNGSYSFDLPSGTYQVEVSAVGYPKQSKEARIEAGAVTVLDFQLEAQYWTFAVITDIHIGRGYDAYSGEDYYLTDRLSSVVDQILKLKPRPEFVVVLGDISQQGRLEELVIARDILNRLPSEGIPYLPVIGNHDYYDKNASHYYRVFWEENHENKNLLLTVFKLTEGSDRSTLKNAQSYAVEYRGILLIAVNNAAHNTSSPYWPPSVRNFFETQLKQASNKNMPVVVFSHVPPISHPLEQKQEHYQWLERTLVRFRANVLAWFCGHVHGFDGPPGFETREYKEMPIDTTWIDGNSENTFLNIKIYRTEAVMVGQNEPGRQRERAVIRVACVEKGTITTSLAGDTPALNPRCWLPSPSLIEELQKEGHLPKAVPIISDAVPVVARCFTKYQGIQFTWHGTTELLYQINFERKSIPHSLAFFRKPTSGVLEVTVEASKEGLITERMKKCFTVQEFYENFESLSVAGWQLSGLWHVSHDRLPCVASPCLSLVGGHARYGTQGKCSYNEINARGIAIRTKGELVSPTIALVENADIYIVFDYYRYVENARRGKDRVEFYVQYFRPFLKAYKWSSWEKIWERTSSDNSPECGMFFKMLKPPSGARFIRVKWVFDSVDSKDNDYYGVGIDNFVLRQCLESMAQKTTSTPTSQTTLSVAEPQEGPRAINIPNPVRDTHTTTFTVLGVEAEALRVEVYDLSGRLVWKAETLGNELVWHTEDLTGLSLANGVYLYLAYVKVDEEWIRLGPQKLVILR